MNKFLQFCILATALFAMTTATQAMIYEYSIDDPAGNKNGGKIYNITTRYNNISQQFSWEYTIDKKNDGFWLVISDGPNPKGINNQLAILYGDLDKGILSAYRYDGKNGPNSYYYKNKNNKKRPNELLQQWDNAFTTKIDGNKKTTSFNINVADINKALTSADWEGIQFGKKIGVWFHPSKGSNFKYYNSNRGDDSTSVANYKGNQIKSFQHRGAGWHDSDNLLVTNEIPILNTLLLLSSGLLAMTYYRRNKTT